MSNSDKFQQDDAIVAAEPEVQGVLAGDDGEGAGDESVANNKIGQGKTSLYTLHRLLSSQKTPTTRRRRTRDFGRALTSLSSLAISVRPVVPALEDEFKNDEFDGVSKDNIIDGERSNRASGFAEAENKADQAVEAAVSANGAPPSLSLVPFFPRGLLLHSY